MNNCQKGSGWVGKEVGGSGERERMENSERDRDFGETGRESKTGRKSYGFVHHFIQRAYIPT